MTRMRSRTIRTISNVLMIIGVIFLVVGAIYWLVPADKLPTLLGHLSKATHHRTQRATLATIAGIVSIGAAILLRVWANARHRRGRRVHSARAA